MTLLGEKELKKVRVANFCDLDLTAPNLLTFSANQELDTVVAKIRQYADLPYVYLVCRSQQAIVTQLLSRLEAIRSPCYPYALFVCDDADYTGGDADLDIVKIGSSDATAVIAAIKAYAGSKFVFDHAKLKFANSAALPSAVDVVIVGAGVTGLYAADVLKRNNLSFCIVDRRDVIGGIWSLYANTTSQVNTSEGAYRIIEEKKRSNRDHSTTREILEDLVHLSKGLADRLYLNTQVDRIAKSDRSYQVSVTRDGNTVSIQSKGVILAVNDRVGTPRSIEWKDQSAYKGSILAGISGEADGFDWRDKKVAIVGMGAFAVENARTALEAGARHVTIICRRHGTVCPKIIDYLNFSTPYDDDFKHDKKSNMRNMMFWKKLYDQSGATAPECWMGKIKHEGHTISVSDIWFIGHFLNKIETIKGSVTRLYDSGLVVDDTQRIEADVIINCVGFHRNATSVTQICDYRRMYNTNYLDKDLMYLADAYLDDDVFNSFFGSSVLEMVKFYMAVYLSFFDKPEFDEMIRSEGIEKIAIEDRSWSHYIAGAVALIRKYPHLLESARNQVSQRTRNFMEIHDLEAYISANKREWIDTHSLLAGKSMTEEECLPYVFERLLK